MKGGSYEGNGSAGDGGPADPGDQQGLLNTVTNITKQRVKLNIKVLGVQIGNSQEALVQSAPEKQAFREKFNAPEMSMISKLMSKVSLLRVVTKLHVLLHENPSGQVFATENMYLCHCFAHICAQFVAAICSVGIRTPVCKYHPHLSFQVGHNSVCLY